jgi:hypothetical protein
MYLIAGFLIGCLTGCLIFPLIFILLILASVVDKKIDQACGLCSCFERMGDNPGCPVHGSKEIRHA